MRYLGLDFGLSHVGLAVADGSLAEPLGEKKYSQKSELFNYLKKLCGQQQIDKIVLGLPEGKLAATVKDFGQKLEAELSLVVFYQDETLSTQAAQAKLIEAGKPQKQRRLDHQAAATLILQDYLDDQH